MVKHPTICRLVRSLIVIFSFALQSVAGARMNASFLIYVRQHQYVSPVMQAAWYSAHGQRGEDAA